MKRLDYSWVILGAGFLTLFFSGGSRFAFGLMLKPMSEELEISRSTLSAAATAFMVVSAIALPFVGRLVDRWSLRGTIAVSAVIAGVGLGLMGRVDTAWQIFVVYGVVYALGNAGTSLGPVTVMVSGWFPNRRGIASSAAVAGNAIGQLVIVTLLAASLVAFGWRSSFSILGLATLAVLAPLALLVVRQAPAVAPAGAPAVSKRTVPSPSARPSARPSAPPEWEVRQALTSRQMMLLTAVYSVCGFQDFFVATHVVAFARDQGMGPVLSGNLLGLMGLMGLLGVAASGALADAFGASRPTVVCFVIRIAIFAFIIFWQSTAAIMLFGLLYGFTFLMTAPLTVVFIGNIFGPARLGTLAGSISMAHQMAGGLGAFAGAWIYDQWGSYTGAFLLMLVLSVAAAATTPLVGERGRGGTPLRDPQ